MVSRKPLQAAAHNTNGLQPLGANPPYPTTPESPNLPSLKIEDDAYVPQLPAQSEHGNLGVWNIDRQQPATQSSAQKPGTSVGIPESLKPGQAPAGYTPKTSQENLALSSKLRNYPYPQGTKPTQTGYGGPESSAYVWASPAEKLVPPSQAPPPPPLPQELPSNPLKDHVSALPIFDGDYPGLNDQVSILSISDQAPHLLNHQASNISSISGQSNNPWRPALNQQTTPETAHSLPTPQLQDSGNEVWSKEGHVPVPGLHERPVLVNTNDEDDSPAWDEDGYESSAEEWSANRNLTEKSKELHEDQHVWGLARAEVDQAVTTSSKATNPGEAVRQADGWNLIDHEPNQELNQHRGILTADRIERTLQEPEEPTPALPPRRAVDEPPPQPLQPFLNTITPQIVTPVPTANLHAQKNETYDIKKINWFDITSDTNPRTSPILVQNANGPCPLLALVNALTLSTPSNVDTALVDTLLAREQVSLGLLLDAVFDELMSGRRGDATQELPDVGDLYSFLIALHTGMNVNPRFLPPAPTGSHRDIRNSMSHVHPSQREDSIPGTFEETREMKLYSTFSIPLIHGWLPDKDSSAYRALSRSAKTYEDAQNLMFREEEVLDKSHREELSFEEQAALEDIRTIKSFLNTSATQLTQHGLNTIATCLPPAGVAILFRNDHFSTLYRHPETLQLLQLVTDMGYAGHQEVVWESLIDVNGENAEFFSGDFRLVSGGGAATQTLTQAQSGEAPGWNTALSQQNGQHNQGAAGSAYHDHAGPAPANPNTEQEDADMALALQLQEEEEERHRNEISRRRRESQLSQQFIEQQGSTHSNSIPVSHRGGGAGRGQRSRLSTGRSNSIPAEQRPAIPPRRSGAGGQPVDPEAGVDQPPPSYEQAATSPAYNPPPDHPAHPSADLNRIRSSSYRANNSTPVRPTQPPRNSDMGRGRGGATVYHGRPGNQMPQQVQQMPYGGRDRDCIVM